ncbi:YobA family protein [Mesobacillus subterraneus]|uniref:DUF3221 domain-containing protein n=1 Tax=Mesobacillus subterraneus TaxID=285983 RepID=UPI0020415C38|nr:DUF3221 domain-containing protein [Mesobacillus subterraneus]MCM3572333.1 YobA family protein [Mesobacillus subterraneus]
MYRKYFNLILYFFCCLLIVACSNESTYSGKVVQKAERNDNSYLILVVKNISDSDLKNKSADELLEIASLPDNGLNFYVDKKTYENIEVGNKVEVTYSGPAQESLPPKVGAKKVKVIE